MTSQEFLRAGTATLTAAGIESAHLDCLLLLEHALKRDRASVLAHPDEKIPAHALGQLYTQLQQRAAHVPLAYIRGHAAFYGRNFVVTPAVLIPRPETEAMIECLLTLPLPARAHIADVGTGSGCLAITAALELPRPVVDAYDISEAALAVAAKNAALHHAIIHCHHEHLLERPAREYDVVLANLPYIPTLFPVNNAARHEPRLALFAGNDGLELYRQLWQQLHAMRTPPSYVATEAMPEQHAELVLAAKNQGYTLAETHGLVQLFTRQVTS